MTTYRNSGGDSGVVAYELGSDYIDVQFRDHSMYRYTNASAGPSSIATMKQLAASGDGLNSFINRHVRKSYSARLR